MHRSSIGRPRVALPDIDITMSILGDKDVENLVLHPLTSRVIGYPHKGGSVQCIQQIWIVWSTVPFLCRIGGRGNTFPLPIHRALKRAVHRPSVGRPLNPSFPDGRRSRKGNRVGVAGTPVVYRSAVWIPGPDLFDLLSKRRPQLGDPFRDGRNVTCNDKF